MAYVTPFLATTNAVISSADCNAGYRGNIMRLREMLPDPGAAGRLLRSLGSGSAATADWVEDGAGSEIDADLLDGQHGSYYATAAGLAAVEAAAFPSGVGAWVRKASEIPTGFTRESALDGRIPVGAGTTFTVTYVEETNYGSSWSHGHFNGDHEHSASALGVSGNTGGPDRSVTKDSGGTNAAAQDHVHDQGSLDVTGYTDGMKQLSTHAAVSIPTSSDPWTIPSRAVVWIRRD